MGRTSGVFGPALMHVTRVLGGYTIHAIDVNANGAWVLRCRPKTVAPQIHFGTPDCKLCLKRLTPSEEELMATFDAL